MPALQTAEGEVQQGLSHPDFIINNYLPQKSLRHFYAGFRGTARNGSRLL
jgi:hypothetical protein